jgi:nitrogen regulatory protein PII
MFLGSPVVLASVICTGLLGDGKIYVSDVETASKIAKGEIVQTDV